MPAKATAPDAMRRGPRGSSMPKCLRMRSASGASWPLRARTLATPSPSRSATTTPRPAAEANARSLRAARDASMSSVMNIKNPVTRLALQPRALRIEEDRGDHLDLRISPPDRAVRADALAQPFATTREQAQSDPMPEHGREGDGGDVALIVFQRRLRAQCHEMRTGVEPRRLVGGHDAYECRSVGVGETGPSRQYASNEILLR